jgi:DNA-damage-inducible protein D
MESEGLFMSESTLDCFHFEKDRPSFEDFGRQNGFRYWFARDLMEMLGYTDYAVFKRGPINKAITVCSTLDIDIAANFEQYKRTINGVEQPDYRLSKFACYLVTMNGDVKKKDVAMAQAYFITVTEAFKRYVQESQQVERIAIRGEVSEREKSLTAVAKNAGIENYAFFQNKGYLGLYNMSINQLKERKGIPVGRSPLDFMGKEELAANLFRITQTEAKIRNEGITGQKRLEDAAFSVGSQVRRTMEDISGTRPENLPLAADTNTLKSAIKSTQKEFLKLDKPKKDVDELLLPFED